MKLKTIYHSEGEMADTPAAIDRENGILYLNPKRWFKLTPFQRKFVKLHEYGHLNLNTDSELEADKYAFEHLAGTEFRSLKQCIECLEEILDENKIGHKVRIDQMYNLAIQWDKTHNKPHLNKGTGSAEAANDDAMLNLVLANSTGQNNTAKIFMDGIQGTVNTIILGAILVVAMFFTLKNTE